MCGANGGCFRRRSSEQKSPRRLDKSVPAGVERGDDGRQTGGRLVSLRPIGGFPLDLQLAAHSSREISELLLREHHHTTDAAAAVVVLTLEFYWFNRLSGWR